MSAAELRYWHLYADGQGISRFKPASLQFGHLPVKGLDDPPLAVGLTDVTGATFLRLAPRQVEDWHPAPRRMFLLVIQGESEVTAGDGTVRRFAPGDLVLMDDTTGKGHITKAIGELDHVALVVAASPPHQ
jgi:hypothetical protein